MTTSYLIESLSKDRLKDKTIINNTVVKGLLIKSTLESIQSIAGSKELNRVITNLEIPQQIALKKRIDTNEWYPVHLMIDLLLQLDHVIGKTDQEIINKIGASDIHSLFTTVEKVKMKFLSTPSLLEFASKKIESLILPAKVQVVSISSNHTNIIINNFFDPSNLMINRVKGMLKVLLQNSGKSNVSIQIQESDIEYSYHLSCIW
ncbi:hypothetical protein EP331_09420 [bacterium]|nr:MAG: hypothetical protein EP331_09420 [bacterium]